MTTSYLHRNVRAEIGVFWNLVVPTRYSGRNRCLLGSYRPAEALDGDMEELLDDIHRVVNRENVDKRPAKVLLVAEIPRGEGDQFLFLS